ncbi:MAG: cfa [Firmicutes bacterium]|nr:cfa [Bacillota bacterium]
MKKALIKSIFEKVKYGGLRVVYWDGEEVVYGDQQPEFHLIFNESPPLNLNIDDPMVGLGEAYMDGIIDYQGSLDTMMLLLERNRDAFLQSSTGTTVMKAFNGVVDKLQQKKNIAHHYDLGNDFFALWLDKTMCYSCGYFEKPDYTLEQAQLAKIGHILKKLNLKPNERLLDIGCGWGWLIIKAAQEYGVKALGITLSEEQYRGDKERIAKLGLEDKVDVKLMNYLDLDEKEYQFDKIVSVGMFEHVGKANLPTYMAKVNTLLTPGGLSLLHTITGTTEDVPTNTWMKKYIFPGGYVPTLRETIWLLPEYDFHLLHVESLRLHYAKTLDIWYDNFVSQLDEVRKKFDERFIRMWSLYLQGCAASFRVSGLNIHQLLFSKGINNDLPMTNEYMYTR